MGNAGGELQCEMGMQRQARECFVADVPLEEETMKIPGNTREMIAAAGSLIALLAFGIVPAVGSVECMNGAVFALDTRSVAPVEVAARDTIPTDRYLVASFPVRLTPGTRLSTALSELGPPGAYTWRGFGMVNGAWVEDPVVQAGQAFILCTTVAAKPTFLGFPQAGAVAVALTPGWNLVGCIDGSTEPYPWSACTVIKGGVERPFRDQSDVAQTVRWYADSTGDLRNNGLWEPLSGAALFSAPAAGTNPWGGYLVNARAACQLVFRRQAASPTMATGLSSGPVERVANSGGWSLRLYAEADGTRDGWLELGVQSEAAAGRGDLDLPKPPAFGDGVQLSITHDGPGGGSPESYLTDFQGAGEDSYTWDLTVSYAGNPSSDGPARLVWRALTAVPEEWHVYLVTGDSRTTDVRAVDMRRTDHYDLLIDRGSPRRLSVRVSREPWPGGLVTAGRTRIVSLGPSPAAADVTVEFQIGAPGVVTLSVFDVQGRVVGRLVSEPLEGGHYTRTWSPAESGVVSGVYFVKLRTPGRADTRRVVVIRG